SARGRNTMPLSPLAGKPAPADLLLDVERLVRMYYTLKPDVGDPQQLVSFGTSGHRGSAADATFTESHILAITQAICDYRTANGHQQTRQWYCRTALHGQGHSRPIRPRPTSRSGGFGRQRRQDHDPAR